MRLLVLLTVVLWAYTGTAAEITLDGHVFTVPPGFQVDQVAGPPLVERPVSADFDEQGRLYVTDSSGSNEPVAVQREQRPHRILRLVDLDGDGRYDRSTVYADKLMFPEGSLWFDGSLYVAAPPEIWKFTDRDDDGVAEEREVWFDGKTLTHCANDLHGPYLGPDGWLYWCKGAFAEQTYQRDGRRPLKTRAAHIFRRHPAGGPIEAVMTGGMDNPVEIVFTPGGERIFTTTFLVHPRQGQRDGLIHAVYGGVYGKDHGALDNHPRTGPLLPVFVHLGAAAPCGLARLESNGLGPGWRNNLLACSFNLHKITRHVLTPDGATFASDTSDLLRSNNLDFHPTDVLEDADGSVLIIDTGGWFHLCCPTSQLEKPDVLGGIYRLRRTASQPPPDPRGLRIHWEELGPDELTELLNDERLAVRQRALRSFQQRTAGAVQPLQQVLARSADADHRVQAVWALTRIPNAEARAAVRGALRDPSPVVRQAALHSISVHQDRLAAGQLAAMLDTGPAANRRAAAEALGRVGSSRDIRSLLSAVPQAVRSRGPSRGTVDRFLEHSLIYAAMELNDPDSLRRSLTAANDRLRRAALIALDQLEGGDHVRAADIESLLVSENQLLNETAWWIAEQHPDWGPAVVEAFRRELRQPPASGLLRRRLRDRLSGFAGSAPVQAVMAQALADAETDESLRLILLTAMASSRQKPLPAAWAAPLRDQLCGSKEVVLAALTALQQLGGGKLDSAAVSRLKQVALDEGRSAEVRLRALNLLPNSTRELNPQLVEFACAELTIDSRVTTRALAVDLFTSTRLNSGQLIRLARQLPRTGAMELQPLMSVFAKSRDQQVGAALVRALLEAPAATALFPDRLQQIVASFGDAVQAQANPLMARIERENQTKLERVEQILALLPQADVRHGLRVFQSTEASCIACHRRGYLGGDVGPDLNRIGQIRTERALLESILFPSLSFVRSYEPVSLVTEDGRVHNGLIRDETDTAVTLQLDAQKSMQILKAAIEERRLGTVSIMPAGLEKQLSPQDLADLVKYLKEG